MQWQPASVCIRAEAIVMGISVRRMRKGDGKGVSGCFNEALRRGASRYTKSRTLLTPKDIRALDRSYSKRKKGEFGFVAIDNKKKVIIGACIFGSNGTGRVRHVGEVGCGVHPDYFRMGVATRLLGATLKEATRRGFVRVDAEVARKNLASIRLIKRCGFRLEGMKTRGLLLDNGKYEDTYVFGKILT